MTRWKLTIEYDGSGFSGWQRQDHAPSVQQTLEEAIQSFSGETPSLFVAGRTDTGVHALGQVAHFDLEKETDERAVRDAINFYVRPHRVAVLKAEIVPSTFHARFDAKARTYLYQVINRRAPLTFLENQAWHVVRPLEIEPMQKAAHLLIGKHDFSTFRASHCQANSPWRTLDRLEIDREGELVVFTVEARSFLYHQVRNMIGTLCLVGTGQWSLQDFSKAFEAADRTKGGPTAPAQGLFFVKVDYGTSDF